MDFKDRMIALIARVGELSIEQIGEIIGKKLIEDYYFDSVKLVQLLVEIEDEFGIVLDDDEIDTEKINSLDMLFRIVEDKTL
ncbi:MAG: acyl carrier protein [Lachnospiraceae bacterium]|nr:acyl carrier protein [Lachnospiraceae bacterium]